MPPLAVKICGLSTPEAVEAAVAGGATYVGFVFFARSPRNIAPERAAGLAAPARAGGVFAVAVTVDASDAELDHIMATLQPELIQLARRRDARPRRRGPRPHRRRSDPGATGVCEPADLDAAGAYEDVVDHLMFDAKPPADAALPGGNGAAFDSTILAGRRFAKPWFLAGGLDAANVAQALAASGARAVDVSSGVESAPGVKDPLLIEAFLKAVRRA